MPLLREAQLPYDRSAVTPGILHFGVGQFCRGHLFYYTHRLLELLATEGGDAKSDGAELNWGIIGVNVMKGDREREMWIDFRKQHQLYSLTLFPHAAKSSAGPPPSPQTTVIGSMIDYLYAPEEQSRVLQLLADPRIRIVSLTVTEGGYNIDENTNEFDLSNAAVRADLSHPREPRTVFGFIVEGLRQRRDSRGVVRPFTVLSCDNLRHNGDVAKRAILGYARTLEPSLATWIEANVSFPNSMVDRITPATTPEMRSRLQSLPSAYSDDEQPVIGEAFSQWVLEDRFGMSGRPAWERVGLELTDQVAAYEHTKIRILNSSHLMLTFTGLLLGYRTVHEALADPDIHRLVVRSLDEDVLPALTSPMDKVKYKDTVLARFSNAAIADQLLRIAGDGTSKVQVFWADNIIAILKRYAQRKRVNPRDAGLENFAFGLASFLFYLHGTDSKGEIFPVVEPKLAPANWSAIIRSDRGRGLLAFNAFDPWRSKAGRAVLDKRVTHYYHLMRSRGVRKALAELPGWQLSTAKL